MSLLLLATLALTTGCETIGKGVNNLLGNETATSDANTARQYEGNTGTKTTIPKTQKDHEQAIAFGLAMHIESLRYSIDKNDTEAMNLKLKGLLESCDETIERLEGEHSLATKEIRSAVAIIRQAGPKFDHDGLKLAMRYLVKVRDG